MEREGEYKTYKNYNVPKEVEEKWLKERKDTIKSKLMIEMKQKEVISLFCDYADLASQTKDIEGIKFLIDFAKKKKNYNHFDAYSSIRFTEAILNSISFLSNTNEYLKIEVIQEQILVLNDLVKNPITISNEFMENGIFPEYLTKEKLLIRANNILKYWTAIIETFKKINNKSNY